jgi:hypothetical protein
MAAHPLPGLSPTLATPAKMPGRGPKAAREFEASLIGSLLESMEKTFAALPGENKVSGADDYNYLGTKVRGRAIIRCAERRAPGRLKFSQLPPIE